MDDAGIEGEDGGDRTEAFVAFRLGAERYALEVGRVREVLDAATLTRVPGGPPGLVGLYNLRGNVVSVWDLRAAFGLAPAGAEGAAPGAAGPSRTSGILVVEPDPGQPSRVAGLLVDRVSDVLDVPEGEVRPAPTLGPGDGSAMVRGVIHRRDHFLLVLDLDRVVEALARESTPEPAPR